MKGFRQFLDESFRVKKQGRPGGGYYRVHPHGKKWDTEHTGSDSTGRHLHVDVDYNEESHDSRNRWMCSADWDNEGTYHPSKKHAVEYAKQRIHDEYHNRKNRSN